MTVHQGPVLHPSCVPEKVGIPKNSINKKHYSNKGKRNLTFIGLCIANIFTQYNQQDATFHNLFISVRRFICFRRFFRPSSGAKNCTYNVRYLSDQYLTLYVQF